jgi:hypothetical protein
MPSLSRVHDSDMYIGSPQLALQTAAHPMSPSSTKISAVCRAPRMHVPATTTAGRAGQVCSARPAAFVSFRSCAEG